MVIVEGPDNSGKTTLIQQLQDEFHIPAMRSGMRPRYPEDISQYHYWAAAAPLPLILDRHPAISDYIYGPILRKATPSSIEMILRCIDHHFVVLCLPPYETVSATYDDRPQLEGTKENLARIYQGYQNFGDDFSVDFIYDYNNEAALSALINQLTHYLARKP